jgi:membrane protease YdiL (CAAX protease family)
MALLLFIPLFVIRAINGFDFWWWMSSNLILLVSLALILEKDFRISLKEDAGKDVARKVSIGIISAIILYFVFFVGDILSRRLFGFAGEEIGNIYLFKAGAKPIRIILMMLLIIGPGEELFWRGFLQRNISLRFGKVMGFMLTSVLYAGVHIASGNIILITAALVCGLFWGWLYLRYQSMIINVVSHTLWDIAVFMVLPFYLHHI